MKSLAVEYRPHTFDEVVEQEDVIKILKNQIEHDEIQHCYLFCGGAGTGKTTIARIFANEINHHEGVPIELDAASNNGVDSMRDLINSARTKPLDGKYKVFVLDEVHMITTAGWNAILKLIEEPPAHAIFIMCTTDPQKIPATILSRVQRYDFHRISFEGIVDRLRYIHKEENGLACDEEAFDYIAKIADGGMRDAITLLDKCYAYSEVLTIDNVLTALGAVNYDTMIELTKAIIDGRASHVTDIVEEVHRSGKDVKEFIKSYMQFVLDLNKLQYGKVWEYVSVPSTYGDKIEPLLTSSLLTQLLSLLINLLNTIRYSQCAKLEIESELFVFTKGDTE